jgi:hypothetical protein
VRGNAGVCDILKKRMRVAVQPIEEQIVYPAAAELARRQTDPVQNDQFRHTSVRALILVWRLQLASRAYQPGIRIHLQP